MREEMTRLTFSVLIEHSSKIEEWFNGGISEEFQFLFIERAIISTSISADTSESKI